MRIEFTEKKRLLYYDNSNILRGTRKIHAGYVLMKKICILKNKIQEYAWGSRTGIAGIMGVNIPSARPQAELWMGAHPKSPSQVFYNNEWHSLLELIARYPQEILGHRVAEQFENKLPFLFKILAAEEPLSIQAHPDLEQAKEGFRRENKLGIPLNAFNRNYKDANHKPEIICALTPFWALNGFREAKNIIELLKSIPSFQLQAIHDFLIKNPGSIGLKKAMNILLTMDLTTVRQTVLETVTFAYDQKDKDPLFPWLIAINELYPGDVGVLCTLLLNLVKLKPGEAMYLPARQLHAYLDGIGVELMANSDNVLRGGLTPKYIDNSELLGTLEFSEVRVKPLKAISTLAAEWVYDTPATEFSLSKVSVNQGTTYASPADRSIEILICTEGKGNIIDLKKGDSLDISSGTSVVIPAAVTGYKIEGAATLYKASVPEK